MRLLLIVATLLLLHHQLHVQAKKSQKKFNKLYDSKFLKNQKDDVDDSKAARKNRFKIFVEKEEMLQKLKKQQSRKATFKYDDSSMFLFMSDSERLQFLGLANVTKLDAELETELPRRNRPMVPRSRSKVRERARKVRPGRARAKDKARKKGQTGDRGEGNGKGKGGSKNGSGDGNKGGNKEGNKSGNKDGDKDGSKNRNKNESNLDDSKDDRGGGRGEGNQGNGGKEGAVGDGEKEEDEGNGRDGGKGGRKGNGGNGGEEGNGGEGGRKGSLKRRSVGTAELVIEKRQSDLPALPSLDLRNFNLVTAPKNQLSCKSCWAFGATAVLEGAFALSTGTLFFHHHDLSYLRLEFLSNIIFIAY